MYTLGEIPDLYARFVKPGNHAASDYFSLIRALVAGRNQHAPGSEAYQAWQAEIDRAYQLVLDEIRTNQGPPRSPVTFGTSGWRGILGKDLYLRSVTQVTRAIISMYQGLADQPELAAPLGVASLAEARERGAVIGFDNRFGGELMARAVVDELTGHGFKVHYAGEATTGTLSAAVLILKAAFSINLTPSHNPLDFGGFKYNAADGGPAAPQLTDTITAISRRIMTNREFTPASGRPELVTDIDALGCWFELVRKGREQHGLDYRHILDRFQTESGCLVAIDCVHGASRVHVDRLLPGPGERVLFFRNTADPTFGGVAPEPSTANLEQVRSALAARPEPLKLGAIIDPDGDRIRFTDGATEIDMNAFGAMAYHHLHEGKGKRGLVAKTVATSNFVNRIARELGEEVFEPRVGFKEFKPVIGRALVCFEESDGITVIGHTPEKDAYIGLLLALDILLSRKQGLGEYLAELQQAYGAFFPAKGGVEVQKQGEELRSSLARLDRYRPGSRIPVAGVDRTISEVITIDGYKFIFEDQSWLMIRPSGTEPKVRFYVESRSPQGREALLAAARGLLTEIGLLGD